jgi:hypothetical protein
MVGTLRDHLPCKPEMDESSSKPYFHTGSLKDSGHWMAKIWLAPVNTLDWVVDTARSSFYLLPGSIELAVSLCFVVYFTIQLAQQPSIGGLTAAGFFHNN